MSEGSVFVRGSDGRACATYKDARGKTRYLYAKTKPEVRRKLRQALKDRDEGIIPPSKMTVGALLDESLDELKDNVSRRTWLNRESLVRVHIKPTIGDTKLARLTGKDVRGLYRAKLASGLSSGTVKRLHVILNQAMRQAVSVKYVPTNPIADIKPPKQKSSEVEVLTPDDLRKLIEAARGTRYEPAFVIGATCGLRIGECLSIRVEDISFDKGTLHIRRTLWRGKVYLPKANSSRVIKLPALALDALRRHAEQNGSEGWLFPTTGNAPIDATSFWRRYWLPVVRKAGLSEKLTYHQLRKSTASLLLHQHVPVAVVANYLGHSPATTYRYYAGIIGGSEGMAASAIDTIIG
jgi:integrase